MISSHTVNCLRGSQVYDRDKETRKFRKRLVFIVLVSTVLETVIEELADYSQTGQ